MDYLYRGCGIDIWGDFKEIHSALFEHHAARSLVAVKQHRVRVLGGQQPDRLIIRFERFDVLLSAEKLVALVFQLCYLTGQCLHHKTMHVTVSTRIRIQRSSDTRPDYGSLTSGYGA